MTRDIQERLNLFEADVNVKRVALTKRQITKYGPPPNPAKLTDSRVDKYIDKYGTSSWELDALEPQVIEDIIKQEVNKLVDKSLLKEVEMKENNDKEILLKIENNYDQVKHFIESEQL
ncbi:hypothetical protein EDD63_11643 [Breznakia blatticola]|uniref:Uncharacterized protein n=2 Tax=Breznakia blatticola TaxID=1754012 RepID=A0A4R7ZSS1_9FIRM|nr:hypothetical protein EDD63_11643 [Breznakia blatticola]